MQKFAGACSPEQLHTLQKIFDMIWMELRTNGTANYTGPDDPDDLRDEVARRVLGQVDGDHISPADITQHVLSSFGIQTAVMQSKGTLPTERERATALPELLKQSVTAAF